jgi:hypothetical protein
MKGTVVASGSLPGFDYTSTRYGREIVHRIKITGPIDLETRLPLYHATLAVNETNNYFCILDNTAGHENNFSYSDIVLLDELLIESGIDHFYGATVTTDPDYVKLVKLANDSAKATPMKTQLLASRDVAEAEAFVMEKLRLFVR